jgi:site-specific DNA recombinase
VAALYPRVSDPKQDEDDATSMKTQEAGERAWALANGYGVVEEHIYRERHSGEEYYERPELTRLRADAKGRKFAVVVVHSVERLARDAVHVGIILEELERAGVSVHFVTESDDDSPDSQLIRFIKAYAGKIENERKKERTMRAVRERAAMGKSLIGCRILYGYQWGPERYPDGHKKAGRLTKERMVADPITSAVVVRIFTLVAEGMALRAVARLLTADGIKSPTGRAKWARDTVRFIVRQRRYWGAGEALATKQEPIAKHLRSKYTGKTRAVRRDASERIPIPTSAVPPLVSPELAAQALARLADHQAGAARHNRYPERALLRGGLARCAYCDHALYVRNTTDRARKRRLTPAERTIYLCASRDKVAAPDCSWHGIEAHLLDDATWAAVCTILRTPGLLDGEREYMRTTERPGTDVLASIDAIIDDLNAQIRRKRRLYEGTDDEQTQDDLQREINDLAAARRAHEAERVRAELHYSDWRQQEAGLDYALAWRERAAGKLDTCENYADKRALLESVHTTVRLWRADHTPRAIVKVRLPLAGTITEELRLGAEHAGADSGADFRADPDYGDSGNAGNSGISDEKRSANFAKLGNCDENVSAYSRRTTASPLSSRRAGRSSRMSAVNSWRVCSASASASAR